MTLPLILALFLAPQQTTELPAPQEAVAPAAPIVAQTWISQTAVWPGDPVDYSIQLDLAPRVELPEDLSGDAMAWAPFRLLGIEQSEVLHEDGSRTVTIIYRLVAVDLAEGGFGQIPPLRVAYVQLPDRPTANEELEAEELIVPGPRIAFRSTLELPAEELTIRDGKELMVPEIPGRTLVMIGAFGLLIGVVPFGRSAHAGVMRIIERRREAEARGSRRQLRQEVAALRSAPLNGQEDYARLYDQLFSVVRDHLAIEREIPFAGLTSVDADALRRAGLPDPLVDKLIAFLSEAEEMRYQSRLPADAEARARAVVALVEQVVAA